MKILKFASVDKYILKQIMETFFPGILIFTSLVFASDQFLYLVKQISGYGIPFKIAFISILLQLPYIKVFSIPMAILLAVILTFNKLNTNNEITIFRACGISLRRLSVPVLAFSFVVTLCSFVINEYVVPAANVQSRNLMVWALVQKSVPAEKSNFSFKEYDVNKQLKRLFYINKYENRMMQGVTVLDLSKPDIIQVIQAKYAEAEVDNWKFYEAVNYTMSGNGKLMNTASFKESVLNSSLNLNKVQKIEKAEEFNYFQLANYIANYQDKNSREYSVMQIRLHEKLSLPATCFLISIIGIPLAISPPRARMNRGLLFSILIIFCYYILRAISSSMGEAQIIEPLFAAWMPNIIVFLTGCLLFYRKEFVVR